MNSGRSRLFMEDHWLSSWLRVTRNLRGTEPTALTTNGSTNKPPQGPGMLNYDVAQKGNYLLLFININ
ncbi:MAG: hypothetical protein ABIQ31_08715 [Ferruginibacter sp.]